MACAADELTNNESASGSSSTGGLLLAKERPGRLLCDGDLRLIEVLRVRLVEARDLPALPVRGSSDRSIFCLVRLDGKDVFQSTSVPKSLNSYFGDEFSHEVGGNFGQLHFILCEQYHGRIPRPFARVSFRKHDVIKYSGQDICYPLKEFSRQSDVSGKICLDMDCQPSASVGDCSPAKRIMLRVLDYSDLNLSASTRPVELYLLVTMQVNGNRLETKKLRVSCKKTSSSRYSMDKPSSSAMTMPAGCSSSSSTSDESASTAAVLMLDLDAAFAAATAAAGGGGSAIASSSRDDIDASVTAQQRPQLRLSLWHDLLGGFNSYFHGELRILLDERTLRPRTERQGPQWYYLKPRLSLNESNDAAASTIISSSSSTTSSRSSSRRQLGTLRLRLSYTADHILPMACYRDLWTNLTDSINQQPFCTTSAGLLELLPAIDLESVARPLMKIFVQTDLIRPLLRILCIHEINRCQDLNTLFRSSSMASKVLYELMKFVGHQYLVISLKPVIDKIYSEKKNCEIDPSKLQQGDNIEQNTQNLIVYAEIAFSRVVDSNHRCPQPLRDIYSDLRDVVNSRHPGRIEVQRLALSSFLIMRFFAAAILNPKLFGLKRENADPTVARTLALVSKILQRLSNCVVSTQALTVKERWFETILERFTDEKHRLAMAKFLDRISCVGGENSISGDSVSVLKEGCLIERCLREKRCFKLNWMLQKRRHIVLTETELFWTKSKSDQAKDRLVLSEVNLIEPIDETVFNSKHVFRVATASNCIYLQASSNIEMTDWLTHIQKQCRRQLMIMRQATSLSQLYDVDVERELEAVHMSFLEHAETVKHWKNALEGSAAIPDGEASIPSVAIIDDVSRSTMYSTVQTVLHGTLMLEKAHRDAIFRYLNQIKLGTGTIDNPIGDDNYLLLKSRMKDLAQLDNGAAAAAAAASTN